MPVFFDPDDGPFRRKLRKIWLYIFVEFYYKQIKHRYWQHSKRPIIAAHKKSGHHRQLVDTANKVGCYFCLKIYDPKEITEWTDQGQTAICPHCGIDSVLPSNAGYELSYTFLQEMKHYWFAGLDV